MAENLRESLWNSAKPAGGAAWDAPVGRACSGLPVTNLKRRLSEQAAFAASFQQDRFGPNLDG